jgi:DNA-binding NarL/FixJ family response regulator
MGSDHQKRKLKKVINLHAEGLSSRLIARNLGLSKNTVMEIVRREASGACVTASTRARRPGFRPSPSASSGVTG